MRMIMLLFVITPLQMSNTLSILQKHFVFWPEVEKELDLKMIADCIDHANKTEKPSEISYSEAIIESNKIKLHCNHGFCHTIEPYKWRGQYVPVLQLLQEYGRSMTATEIKRKFGSKEQSTFAKCPSELVSFGAVRISGTRAGQRLYAITTLGKQFLNGEEGLPSFAYKTGVRLPANAPKAPVCFIYQVKRVEVEPILVESPVCQ